MRDGIDQQIDRRVRQRFNRAALGLAVLTFGAIMPSGKAFAQSDFPQTLGGGSGLVDIPTAWVSPLNGDFDFNWSARSLQTSSAVPEYQHSMAGTGSLDVSLFRHAEVGVSLLSGDFEHAFYGKVLLLNEEDFRGRRGSFLPSLAIGMRNIGPYSHIDRLGLGYAQQFNAGGGSAPIIVSDSLHRAFSTGNTVYGVATKSFSLADIRSSWPDVGVSLSLGYGNGLFSNHGALPTRVYAADATGGFFYGIKADYRPNPNTLVSIMGENNAWDFNIGTYVSYRGLRAGLGVTELGAGSAKFLAGNPASALYRYTKLNLSLGWTSNLFALLRGNVLQNRVAKLEKERDLLLADIGQRQQRIASLQVEIRRYEAQNLLELEERRAQAQTQLQTETDALRRLEERLRRVENETQSAPPPPTTQPAPDTSRRAP